MGGRPKGEFSASTLHSSILQEVSGRDMAELEKFQRLKLRFTSKKMEGKMPKIIQFHLQQLSTNRSDSSSPEVLSPLDTDDHGSQAASIAAGAIVEGANMLGLGLGDARGGVPGARRAVYKICWIDGCSNPDSCEYFTDPLAIGSFHAMKHGIPTSTAAGNYGPTYASVSSVAPWTLSVAASTIDRKFVTKVKLGNGEIYKAGDAGLKGVDARNCYPDNLDKKKVKGKIILCKDMNAGIGLVEAEAAGMVMQNGSFDDVAYDYFLPASYLSNGSALFNYLKGTKKPTAKLFKSNEEKDRFSPSVASFSSRGPNLMTHDILKVTNVGSAVSTYKALVNAPKGLTIKATPSTLSFISWLCDFHAEMKSFVVNVTVIVAATTPVISSSLTWDDGVHRVRSPVVGYRLQN
ncbi:hypothetical protein SLEP1_g10732 [Rubroshorea leprosula]|uniref:Subtilisin-like protease fibronectin type-III domain-containing protein n=1 Tax=Rubroshorea leprosula TaxID=152421 RepID=A0AAV5IEQ9_9ROSI|nr:hypothetical protein SLEP1_g10732 [Rubroshorea leprosula]